MAHAYGDADAIETLLGLLGGDVLEAFPTGDRQTYMFSEDPDDDDDTEDDNRPIAMSTFNGMHWARLHVSDTCTAVTDGDSEITRITGDLDLHANCCNGEYAMVASRFKA